MTEKHETVTIAWPVYILAGGNSSRFGTDKARAELEGTPLIVRVADALAPIAESITVIADTGDNYADLGLATMADCVPDAGPLGGLLTALQHHDASRPGANTPWIVLLSCDLVRCTPQWIQRLAAARRPESRCAAFGPPDAVEPFPALYHTALCERVRRHLQTPRRSIRDLLDDESTCVQPHPPDWPAVPQINTRLDLTAARTADCAFRT
jgi:molybdopterin-guanine dinucleotide biosynthesis protein A